MENGTGNHLWVALVGTPWASVRPQCDPAFDVDAAGAAEALMRYVRARTPETLAAIPRKAGSEPVLFRVGTLTPKALRWIAGGDSEETKLHRAFLCACHAYRDENGHEHAAKVERTPGGFVEAAEEWLDEVLAAYGGNAVLEVGKVALDRAQAGPRATDPFVLPRGLVVRP